MLWLWLLSMITVLVSLTLIGCKHSTPSVSTKVASETLDSDAPILEGFIELQILWSWTGIC